MNNISGVGTTTSYNPDIASLRFGAATDASAVVRAPSAASTTEVQIDETTQQPVPPRFPWLSRLTAELEAAARQRPTFPPTASLGNNLDKKA